MKKDIFKIPPLIALPHAHIANLAKIYKPKRVIDMGGRGRLKKFIKCSILDANIHGKPKLDGQDLPFDDGYFDVAVSVNTLEHVDNQYKFLQESVRVSKKAIIHFFLCGKYAKIVEDYKKKCGHKHNHVLPRKEDYTKLITNNTFSKHKFYCTMSCREHLSLLAAMFPYMNKVSTYNLIEKIGRKEYSYILYCEI